MYKKLLYLSYIISLAIFSLTTKASSNSTPQQPSTTIGTSSVAGSTTTPAQDAGATKSENSAIAPLQFLNAWARPSIPPNNNSVIYLSIKNNTNQDYELIGASALSVANNVELHQSFVDTKGVSKMAPISTVIIPANTQVDLTPGGTHIMLFDLKHSLSNGNKFKLDLKFTNFGTQTVEVVVQSQQP